MQLHGLLYLTEVRYGFIIDLLFVCRTATYTWSETSTISCWCWRHH